MGRWGTRTYVNCYVTHIFGVSLGHSANCAYGCYILNQLYMHHQSGSQKSSRYTAAPLKTFSEKKLDLMILKKQQEELERQANVSLRLKKRQNKMKQYVLEQQSSCAYKLFICTTALLF